jgi:hypothetical protein
LQVIAEYSNRSILRAFLHIQRLFSPTQARGSLPFPRPRLHRRRLGVEALGSGTPGRLSLLRVCALGSFDCSNIESTNFISCVTFSDGSESPIVTFPRVFRSKRPVELKANERVLEVLQIYGSTMKTETDRRGFGGKVSAIRVCVPWRVAPFLVCFAAARLQRAAQDTREKALARF